MKFLVSLLRDPAWTGIAAIAAMATLVVSIADKLSPSFRAKLNRAGSFVRRQLKLAVYSCYGIIWGVPTGLVALFLADLINLFADGAIRVPGEVGEVLLRLSEIRVLGFDYQTSVSSLGRQFGCLGFYGGALAGFLVFLYRGWKTGSSFSNIPRSHHFMALFGFLVLLFIVVSDLLKYLVLGTP
jgi:hypothetical protein